jgi:hypothetical protein
MERFVYVQQGEGFEKRNVKVGVSDFFNAEIQEGLKEGEVVSLELPKDERDKKAQQATKQRKGGGEAGSPGARAAGPASGTRTNPATASGIPATGADANQKASPKKAPSLPATHPPR